MEWLSWLVAAAILSPCLGSKTEKLFVKYGLPSLDPLHVDSFFEMPRMRSMAEGDGWAMAEDRTADDGYAIFCRNNDYRVCLLFDGKGSVAGIQISMSVEDVQRSATPYPMELSAMQEKKRMLDTDVYAATLLFVDDGVLKSGGRVLTNETKTAPNGMCIKLRDGGHRMLPIKEDDLEGTLYQKQGCVDAMGRHYFYNLSSELDCSDLEPFQPVYCAKSHELIGVAYLTYGRPSVEKYGRRWFESMGPGLKVTAPDGPDCMKSWSESYGVASLHVYISNEPWKIQCGE